jgi:alkanesulfonate monooxygenase SsuD/methylene tetrahydromethanopterin reductase-like flavin-dependent oxidoreductase (luciferase family)
MVTSRYGRPLAFGVSIVPASADLEVSRSLARRADELGLDLIGIQDHPLPVAVPRYVVAASRPARAHGADPSLSRRRQPSFAQPGDDRQAGRVARRPFGGRFELGLGTGAFWEAIGAMGGPIRSGREALQALEEAIGIIRAFWSGERTIAVAGEHYSVRGLHPGPQPAHPIGIWLGVGKPRALVLTGRSRTAGCRHSSGRNPSLFPR